jgi:hypothetical protein
LLGVRNCDIHELVQYLIHDILRDHLLPHTTALLDVEQAPCLRCRLPNDGIRVCELREYGVLHKHGEVVLLVLKHKGGECLNGIPHRLRVREFGLVELLV